MKNGLQPESHRVNFLLRRVIVPSWLQVILLITYTLAFVSQLVADPLRLLVVIAASVVVAALVIMPLQQRAGQPTVTDNIAEMKAAPTREVAVGIRWRQLRTYQVWHLTVLIALSAGVLLDVVGVPTP